MKANRQIHFNATPEVFTWWCGFRRGNRSHQINQAIMAHIKVEAGDADEPVDLLDPENGVLSRFIDYLYKQGNRGIQSARDLADVLDDFMSPEPPEELIKVVDAAEVINRGPRMYGLLEGVETLSLEPRRGFDDGF